MSLFVFLIYFSSIDQKLGKIIYEKEKDGICLNRFLYFYLFSTNYSFYAFETVFINSLMFQFGQKWVFLSVSTHFSNTNVVERL